MTNYNKGKIYKIWSVKTDKVYIGSTCVSLSKRKFEHLKRFKYYCEGKCNLLTSFDIIDIDPDFRLDLVEEYPCETKEQLMRREGEIILEHSNRVNKQIAGRTKKEYYEVLENKLRKKESTKESRKRKLEVEPDFRKRKYICVDCDKELSYEHKARHERTAKHIKNCDN